MASSQVEIPSSSQRFGFILRDRNQNAVVFQKNLKPPVKNHHELFKSHISDENSENFIDSWIETNNKSNNRTRLTEKPIVRTSAPPVETKRNDNLGASSLVQIWEARLNRSNGGKSPNSGQSTVSSSRNDSGISVQDSHFSESPSIDGDSELVDENVDGTVEIESGSHGLVSDSGESKWGRVADLVRRLSNEDKNLTAGNNGGSCGGGGLAIIRAPRPCTSLCSSLSSEKISFPVVNFSPRIRGRQAFTDLLMKMERDRHRELDLLLERNAVSRFAQRGRLQSMLRLKNLNRCLAIQYRSRSNAKTTKTTGLNRIEPGSTVLHLREKFRTNAAAAGDQTKDHHRAAEVKNKAVEGTTENTSLKKGGVTLEAFFMKRLNIREPKIVEATLCKEGETVNGTVESKTSCLQMQERGEAEETCNDGKSEKIEEEKTSPRPCITQESRLNQNQSEDKMESQTQGVVHESFEMDQYLGKQETSYLNGWEEYEDEQSYYEEANNDWLSEISRPRSYWEELRKSRYLEVMNTQKEDIRRLLERGTVTDFLESGLREKIDNLMMSRVQTHSNKHSEKWELRQEEEEEEKNEIEEEEPLTEGEEDQDDRNDSSRSSSSHMFASSPAGSWSSQDTEVTSTPASSVHNPHSPVRNGADKRYEITDQQLQQEMSLLRDSVKTCLDANERLQSSHRENPLKRNCCGCNETQVEAVLYKCGHMCMCLKCANELHWSGGKCPICRAQIVDVVRVFLDTRN